MFRFGGRLGRKRFAWGAAIRLLLMAAGIIGFPYLVWIVGQYTACSRIGGACGAVALTTSMFGKPPIVMLFIFSFCGICLRRARDAGLPAAIGLVVPFLLLRDTSFLVLAGAHWSFAMVAGVVSVPVPFALIVSLLCIAVLCLLPSRDRDAEALNPFGKAGYALLALIVAATIDAAIHLLRMTPVLLIPSLRIGINHLPHVPYVRDYVMYGLLFALAYFSWVSFVTPAPSPLQIAAGVPVRQRKPLAAIGALALVIAIAACRHVSAGQSLVASTLQRPDALLPTLALYFCLLIAGYLLVVAPSLRSAAFLGLTFLPFVHVGYMRWTAEQAVAKETAEIAAIPRVKNSALPTTVLFQPDLSLQPEDLLAVPGVDRVISGVQGSGRGLMLYERAEDGTARRMAITNMPERYLHLRVGAASTFGRRQFVSPGLAAGPYELRLLDSGRDDLVDVWYRSFRLVPAFPPVLSPHDALQRSSIWYRVSGTGTPPRARVLQFLASAVRPAG